MKNVKQLLEEAGSDLTHIVKTTTYLIDPRYREPVYQKWGNGLKACFPFRPAWWYRLSRSRSG